MQPDFGLFEVWGSDPGLLSTVVAGHFPHFKTPSSKLSSRLQLVSKIILCAGNPKACRHSVPATEKSYFRDLFQFPLNIDVLAQPCADRWMLVEEAAIRAAKLCFPWEGHSSPWSSSRDLGRIQQPFLLRLSTRKPAKHKPLSQGLLPKSARKVGSPFFDSSRQQGNPSRRRAFGWTASVWNLVMRSTRWNYLFVLVGLFVTRWLPLQQAAARLLSENIPEKRGVFWCRALLTSLTGVMRTPGNAGISAGVGCSHGEGSAGLGGAWPHTAAQAVTLPQEWEFGGLSLRLPGLPSQGLPTGPGTPGASLQPGLPTEFSAVPACPPASLKARAL